MYKTEGNRGRGEGSRRKFNLPFSCSSGPSALTRIEALFYRDRISNEASVESDGKERGCARRGSAEV